MRGMHKSLWHAFCLVVVAYSLYKSPVFILWTAVVVFVGGGIVLTVIVHAAARYSMPRPASSYLPKEKSDDVAGK